MKFKDNLLKRYNESIRSKIHVSMTALVLIIVLLASSLFSLVAINYVEYQVKSEIDSASTTINNIFYAKNGPWKMKDISSIQEFIKTTTFMKMNGILNISYTVYDPSENVVAGNTPRVVDPSIFISKFIDRDNYIILDTIKEFNVDNINYIGNVISIENSNSEPYYVLTYADINPRNSLVGKIIVITLLLLLLASIIAYIVSKYLANRLAKPIQKLTTFANSIAKRDFKEFNIEGTDEISVLGNTMNNMAHEIQKYDDMQKELIQSTSHELRTPVMTIQGYAECIKYEVSDNTDQDIDKIIETCHAMTQLINNILQYTRTDLNNLNPQLDIQNIEVLPMINECVNVSKGLNTAIEVETNIKEGLVYPLDNDEFKKVITNILCNSFRYAKNKILVKAFLDEDSKLNIFIEDDGKGLSETDTQLMFEKYYKGDDGNYGLGLYTSKLIVQNHNGLICGYNKDDGTGAIFKIIV